MRKINPQPKRKKKTMGKKEIASHVFEIVIGLIVLSLLFLLCSHGLKCWTGWIGLIGLIPLWMGIKGLCRHPSKALPTAVAESKPETK
jgi:cadmium resistance protein CadD (predicted permease)